MRVGPITDKRPISHLGVCDNMLEQGIQITFIGMGAVFLFLLVQVLCMNLTAGFFTRFAHLFQEAPVLAPPPPATVAVDDDEQLAVAIAVARAQAAR